LLLTIINNKKRKDEKHSLQEKSSN
jgi:hypothetical protein